MSKPVRLTDLEPRWIHPNIFVFLCPHCRDVLLCCKNREMTYKETFDALRQGLGDDWNRLVVPPKHDFSWTIRGTMPSDHRDAFPDDLTVTPSIDASASGHWHGFITNGEIQSPRY